MFDTCTHKCGYCWLAESGQVLDFSQLVPFEDLEFVGKIRAFFLKRTSPGLKWLLALTGGEPLLAPNLDRLVEPLFEAGNRIALYTALLLGSTHPGFRFLLRHRAPQVEYIMASFHPEAELDDARFFDKIQMLKDAGHNVMLRFVGQPRRLTQMASLAHRCRELDVAFYPTAMFSNRYPGAYSAPERELLKSHFTSLSQHIQLEGGLDTTGLKCYAGSRIIAVNLQTGNITPCISVHRPSLGNLFEDRLELFPDSIFCPEPGIGCTCDVHYQQDIVIGACDGENFKTQLRALVPPRDLRSELEALEARGLHFHRAAEKGMGDVSDDTRGFFTIGEIKDNYRKRHGVPRVSAANRNLTEVPGIVGEIRSAGSGGTLDLGTPIKIVTARERWSYAAEVLLNTVFPDVSEIWVRVRAKVLVGEAGFGLLSRAGDNFHERAFVSAGPEVITMYLRSSDPPDLASLIIENSSSHGDVTEIELFDVAVLAGLDQNASTGGSFGEELFRGDADILTR
jgi:MoaA/NifB/PqqE/SkfB family radical SAM enzyme